MRIYQKFMEYLDNIKHREEFEKYWLDEHHYYLNDKSPETKKYSVEVAHKLMQLDEETKCLSSRLKILEKIVDELRK